MGWKRWSIAGILAAVMMCAAAEVRAGERVPSALDWSAGEAALFGGFMLLSVVDLYQTAKFETLGFREANPLIGDPPNIGLAAGLKLGLTAGSFFLIHYLVPRGIPRLIVLGLLTSLVLGITVWNEAASGGIIFRF